MLAIAHRGASGHRPENTLSAFELAIELGADMIELDAQPTADGQIVVIHDDTLDRTTDGAGPVAGATLAQIRRLDAGSWFGPTFAGERVPTLAEVLERIRGRSSLNLELKGRSTDGALEAESLASLRESGLFEDTVVSSFAPSILRRVRALDPAIRIGVLLPRGVPPEKAFSLAADLGAEAVHPELSIATPELVAAARERGLAVRVWPVNDPDDLARIEAAGVEAVFTDYPDRLTRRPVPSR